MMKLSCKPLLVGALLALVAVCHAQGLRPGLPAAPTQGATASRSADYVVALVNSDPITAFEVQQETLRISAQLAQRQQTPPGPKEMFDRVLERLINEKIQLQWARRVGIRVDDAAVDDAELTVARQNQILLPEMHKRLAADGIDRATFRGQLRDQILLMRLREREVLQRVRVSDLEVEQYLRERQQSQAAEAAELDLAHILVALPDEASTAQIAAAQAKAQALLERARVEPDFAKLARENSNAPDAAEGGQFGMRPADRYPSLFVEAAQKLAIGDLVVVRSGAGFHVLKMQNKRMAGMPPSVVRQTRASHILLRLSPQLGEAAALERMTAIRQRITAAQTTFEAAAREVSQDPSAAQGGDLGWAGPGLFVPEFEEVMNSLPIGQMSEPFVSRFGVHLMVVNERRSQPLTDRQVRDSVRGILREKKQEEAYAVWAEELRSRAFVEMRPAPGG
jgi:peptidyl-prolyl cis-trans isomerase SurA